MTRRHIDFGDRSELVKHNCAPRDRCSFARRSKRGDKHFATQNVLSHFRDSVSPKCDNGNDSKQFDGQSQLYFATNNARWENIGRVPFARAAARRRCGATLPLAWSRGEVNFGSLGQPAHVMKHFHCMLHT